MKETAQSSFKFNGFKILKSIIRREEDELSKQYKIGIKPSGKYFVSENRFKLQLIVQVINDSNFLTIEVEALAEFEVNENSNEQMLNNFFYINAPAILFPYIRAYVSTLTTLSGMSTITLPTLNLTHLTEELKKNTETIEGNGKIPE